MGDTNLKLYISVSQLTLYSQKNQIKLALPHRVFYLIKILKLLNISAIIGDTNLKLYISVSQLTLYLKKKNQNSALPRKGSLLKKKFETFKYFRYYGRHKFETSYLRWTTNAVLTEKP